MHQILEIRHAVIDDVPALQEIFDYETNLDKLERYPDRALIGAINSPDNLFLVASTGATLQCFIWVTGLDDSLRGPKIEEFASRSPGAGCGSYLFRHAMEQILDRRHKRIWLAVAADNVKAIRFYRKFGFVEKEIREAVWSRRSGDVADGLLMDAAASDLIEVFSKLDRSFVS